MSANPLPRWRAINIIRKLSGVALHFYQLGAKKQILHILALLNYNITFLRHVYTLKESFRRPLSVKNWWFY
jgi:hypothetical protein